MCLKNLVYWVIYYPTTQIHKRLQRRKEHVVYVDDGRVIATMSI
jgi:hypothetical protein